MKKSFIIKSFCCSQDKDSFFTQRGVKILQNVLPEAGLKKYQNIPTQNEVKFAARFFPDKILMSEFDQPFDRWLYVIHVAVFREIISQISARHAFDFGKSVDSGIRLFQQGGVKICSLNSESKLRLPGT